MDAHYESIAQQYNYFYEEIHRATTSIVINKLQLQEEDSLLDIGAGTGQLISFIREVINFKNPVTGVEPCDSFANHLRKMDGIAVVKNTAKGYFDELIRKAADDKIKVPFNKVTIISAFHHFTDPITCLHHLVDFLPKKGICLIADRPSDKWRLPMARRHIEDLRSIPTATYTVVPHLLTRNDVVIETFEVPFSYKVKKGKWYDMIRGRFMSNLQKYTDKELEESIKELEEEKFSGIQDEEDILITDHYVITTFTKTM